MAKSCLLDVARFGDFAIISKGTPAYLSFTKHTRQMLHRPVLATNKAVVGAPGLNLG